jgi:hypothetical protein
VVDQGARTLNLYAAQPIERGRARTFRQRIEWRKGTLHPRVRYRDNSRALKEMPLGRYCNDKI